MIVAMQDLADETQIQQVIEHLVKMGFEVHRSTGARQTVLGAVGAGIDFDIRNLELLPGVQEVHRISSPYKLAGKSFRPEGTIVKLANGVAIGGNEVVVMAGPCTVETREQLFATAEAVAKAGARVLRGGAFKPRSSPYSFQGHGEDALKLLRDPGKSPAPRAVGGAPQPACSRTSASIPSSNRVRLRAKRLGSRMCSSISRQPCSRPCSAVIAASWG